MQPWVRQTEAEMQELKDKLEKLNLESTQGVSPVDTQNNSSLQDTFTFIPKEDGTILTQANAIDFVGDITSSASVKVDGSITVGQKPEFTEGAEGVEVTGSAPYFEVSPGATEVNPVTGKQFATPGTFKMNDTSLDMNAYGQIAGNGLSISLSNDSDLMGYAQSISDVTYGVIYIEGSDWVEGQPLDEIPVIVYEIPLTDINRALFVAGAYVDVEGIDPVDFDIINGLISEVEIDEIDFKLYFKIQGENLALTYVSGGQVSLNSPSQKYESVISVGGPGQENNFYGSRISQRGVFLGPNSGTEYEAVSSLEAGGLVTPIVNAKDMLVVSQTGIYIQEEEPTNPVDGDLWINPNASAEVWELASTTNAELTDLQGSVTDLQGNLTELSDNFDVLAFTISSELNQQVALINQRTSDNHVLNSGFDFWQRGTSFAVSSTRYTADRWRAGRTSSVAGATISRSSVPPTGLEYGIVVRRDAGNTSTQAIILAQTFETSGIEVAGKRVTLSFYGAAGGSYSASGDQLSFGFTSSSASPETVGYASGGLFISSNPDLTTGSATANLTSSYQRFTADFFIPSTANALQIWFRHNPTGTAGTDDFFRISGVQLEGASAFTDPDTPSRYKRNSPNIQAELAACQRYYQTFTSANTTVGFGHGTTTTNVRFQIPTTVQMRAAPTMTFTDFNWIGGATGALVTSASASQSSAFGVTGNATVPAVSVNTVYIMRSDSMTLEAEL
jgi:hypothetical protein